MQSNCPENFPRTFSNLNFLDRKFWNLLEKAVQALRLVALRLVRDWKAA